MPSEDVLYRINTIAGMAGIEEVKAGLLGLNVATLGLVAGLAILYKIGSDGVDNYKKQEEAVKQLEQAYATQGQTYAANRAALEAFIATNSKFISNQYDVMAAMAILIRAGNSETDALRILNDALDRSAQTHEDVSVEAIRLERALQGNAKALKELGIFTEYQTIQNNKLLTTEEKHAAILALIETRTKDGRLAVDGYAQSTNELNISWQHFTGQVGGPIVGMLTAINQALSTGIQLMDLYNQLVQRITGQGGVIQRTINPGGTPTRAAPVQGSHGRATATGAGVPGNTTLNITIKADPMNGQTADAVAKALLMHARYRPGL